MHSVNTSAEGWSRRRLAAAAGHLGDAGQARELLRDQDAEVRAAALAALVRCGHAADEDLASALQDRAASVRRRAVELAAARPGVELAAGLADEDPMVVEAACFACGERAELGGVPEPTLAALTEVAGIHDDPLCRESAVAALGALGEPGTLAVILAALGDKPAVRRRAVLALASFEGPDVDAALARALDDRDWQVRQAAEDLLDLD
ncbi:MAG: HEAT repeat domain-containing protein [Acidimicrobiales bacterium]